jgi:hypothetical protein
MMERDFGSLGIYYELDGTVTITVRTPGEKNESKITMLRAAWEKMNVPPTGPDFNPRWPYRREGCGLGICGMQDECFARETCLFPQQEVSP